jgi:hypothetical protein
MMVIMMMPRVVAVVTVRDRRGGRFASGDGDDVGHIGDIDIGDNVDNLIALGEERDCEGGGSKGRGDDG